MNAEVNRDTCIGCGICASTSPEVYTMDDESKSVALDGEIKEELQQAARDGADACPVNAISIDE